MTYRCIPCFTRIQLLLLTCFLVVSNQLNEVNIYTPGRNNGEPGLSTSFGPDRFYDLALLRTEAVSISKRPGISLINVAIARQLPGGFRFGLGLLVYRNLSPRRLSQEEVTNLANAGEVIYSRRLSYGESFLYGQVSYTFRPQRRLRPSVGLFIASIRGDYSGTGIITLIDGGTGEVIDRSDGRSLQWIASDVFALAKIGLQYQLIRSFSIGFDAALLLGEDSYFEVPFISFGARYGFTGKG